MIVVNVAEVHPRAAIGANVSIIMALAFDVSLRSWRLHEVYVIRFAQMNCSLPVFCDLIAIFLFRQ